MKVCPRCRMEYEDKFVFCHHCGSKLQEKIEQNFCPFCGNKIETDGDFCPFCGNSLEETEPVVNDSIAVDNSSSGTVTKTNVANLVVKNDNLKNKQSVSGVKDSDEPFFSKQHLLNYEGRRGRISYLVVQTFWSIISEILMFLTFGNLGLIIIVILVLAYPRFCNIAKRIHDLNKPTSWAIVLFILGEVASIVIHSTGSLAMADKSALYGRLIIAIIICIPFFVLLFKKGTDGPNQYGENPV